MAKLYAKAPDGSDALLSIVITGFTQSLQQNGWCKLPNSLIFQWGQIAPARTRWSFPLSIGILYSVSAIIQHNAEPEYANAVYNITNSSAYFGASTTSFKPAYYIYLICK